MINPYSNCPTFTTESFQIRPLAKEDASGLFRCYNNPNAVRFMNDDNCDFGFFVETEEKMKETVGYWLDFYKKQYFTRFTIVSGATGDAIGTIEGFGGETGVLRVDICEEYEKESYLSEIFKFAKQYFHEMFQNDVLVTKAIEEATERRKALTNCGWTYIGEFRVYPGYYKIELT